MYKIDIKSLKMFTFTAILCTLIALIIMPAYNYLPENHINISPAINYEELSSRENKTAVENTSSNSTEIDITIDSNKNIVDEFEQVRIARFEEIDELNNKTDHEPTIDDYTKTLNLANEYKNSQKYTEAIKTFKEATKHSKDSESLSKCYEEIAIIYGIEKQYGIALYYAQKAYKIQQSNSLEILLAKLYYKTGDNENAKIHIDRIVQNDFTTDR